MTEPLFVVLQKGLYLTPEAGHSGSLKDAGTFTLEQISQIITDADSSMRYMLADEAPQHAPGCEADQIIRELRDELTAARRELAVLKAWKNLPDAAPTKYIYFVSYSHNHGVVNMTMEQNAPWDETTAESLCDFIHKNTPYEDPAILSFTLLRTETVAPEGVTIQ